MTQPLVNIAGPYSISDPVINTRRAVRSGLRIHDDTGAGVIIPHLTMLAQAMFPRPIEFWYKYDLAVLEHCTHLLRLDGESTGADKEVRKAQELGIKLYYGEYGEHTLIHELRA